MKRAWAWAPWARGVARGMVLSSGNDSLLTRPRARAA